jgi:hypothetical protein
MKQRRDGHRVIPFSFLAFALVAPVSPGIFAQPAVSSAPQVSTAAIAASTYLSDPNAYKLAYIALTRPL